MALAVVVALGGASAGATLACLWTAADALTSDLVGATAQGTHAADGTIFFCGNFGLILKAFFIDCGDFSHLITT